MIGEKYWRFAVGPSADGAPTPEHPVPASRSDLDFEPAK